MGRSQLGVAVVGAGMAAQAIHLPTLARMGDLFRIIGVVDPDEGLAEAVASRAGAVVMGFEEAAQHPMVDVLVLCSPDHLHADQIIRASRQGVKGIMCEKPLCVDLADVERISEAVQSSGIALVVGAQHQYDPTVLHALELLEQPPPAVDTIVSSIVLPPNNQFEDLATQPERPRRPGAPPRDDWEARVAFLEQRILTLSIHDLPLVRQLAPGEPILRSARIVAPHGAVLTFDVAGCQVDLISYMGASWRPDWTLAAWSQEESLRIAFPPSYVHVGSATATITGRSGLQTVFSMPGDGYDWEWQELHRQVSAGDQPRWGLGELVADITYALRLSQQIRSVLEEAT